MTRVSKIPLKDDLRSYLYKQFWRSISRLSTVEDVSLFFSDFLTDTEEYMLAKRLAVAVLLLRGKRPVEVVQILHVTYTMVGSVASWMKNAKPPTQKVLQSLSKDVTWMHFFDQVDSLLDALPPSYHTNWSRVARERRMRERDRIARRNV